MKIEGKRVVVTGAGRGLGREIALACLRAGAGEVVAGTRSQAAVESLQAEAGDLASRLATVQLDVRSNEDVERAASRGRADILNNDASIAGSGSVLNLPPAQIEDERQVNYLGVVRMARAFAPAMIAHGDGLVVNVASQLSKVSMPL